MKKVMVIYAYGKDWDYNLYLVSDKVARRVEKLLEEGECVKAYELVCRNDKKTKKYTRRKDWHSLDTIDMLLECFEGMI